MIFHRLVGAIRSDIFDGNRPDGAAYRRRLGLILAVLVTAAGCAAPSAGTESSARPSEPVGPTPKASAPPRYRALSEAFHRSLFTILADSRAVAARESGARRVPHLTPSAPPKPSRKRSPPVQTGRAKPLYHNALALYRVEDYQRSRRGFQAFLERFPRHSLSDNAQYWIGECWYAEGEYRKAGVAFRSVLVEYNDSNKFPDAYFKLGLCYHLRGDETEARGYWARLVQRYPDTRAAALARGRLSRDGAD